MLVVASVALLVLTAKTPNQTSALSQMTPTQTPSSAAVREALTGYDNQSNGFSDLNDPSQKVLDVLWLSLQQ